MASLLRIRTLGVVMVRLEICNGFAGNDVEDGRGHQYSLAAINCESVGAQGLKS